MKVRGNAQQIVEKYQTLAREAATAGDPVMAENYYQHAEHYYRILNANGDARPAARGGDEERQNGAELRNGSGEDVDEPENSNLENEAAKEPAAAAASDEGQPGPAAEDDDSRNPADIAARAARRTRRRAPAAEETGDAVS